MLTQDCASQDGMGESLAEATDRRAPDRAGPSPVVGVRWAYKKLAYPAGFSPSARSPLSQLSV